MFGNAVSFRPYEKKHSTFCGTFLSKISLTPLLYEKKTDDLLFYFQKVKKYVRRIFYFFNQFSVFEFFTFMPFFSTVTGWKKIFSCHDASRNYSKNNYDNKPFD